jgi:Holliday junction resolvase RusA-like endonuclease
MTITVLGCPAPKGSMVPYMPHGGAFPRVKNDNPRTSAWQLAVAWTAKVAVGSSPPLEGPVSVKAVFFMPRPKSLSRRVRWPVARKNDIDKLERTILDGLTNAGVFRDDGQVVYVTKVKAFAGGVADPAGETGVPRLELVVEALVER